MIIWRALEKQKKKRGGLDFWELDVQYKKEKQREQWVVMGFGV